ncbi:aaa family atpase [Diplodia corticola]|uniref:Aaa family atpase n=1 Tax=Diplodia corticola TaxID=236234 RepID=A0A1J9QIG8_9PEZI|nr:aaa family atpase [Diplodia corticola]OJD28646.1 aaa family atpase [Diplodia corticola]
MASGTLREEPPGGGDDSYDQVTNLAIIVSKPIEETVCAHDTGENGDILHSEVDTKNQSTSGKDHDDSHSAHGQDTTTDQIYQKVQLLESKLKEMQDLTERERAEREKMRNPDSDDYPGGLPHLPYPMTAAGLFDHPMSRDWFRFGRKGRARDVGYMSLAIRQYEREIEMLTGEKEKIDGLHEEIRALRLAEGIWAIEREGLLKNQQKVEKAASLCEETGHLVPTHEDAENFDILPTKQLETPALNYVEWSIFKAISKGTSKESFAIDVLKGEPIVTFDYNQMQTVQSRKGNLLRDDSAKRRRAPVPAKEMLLPGQAPLPERIRINSTHITKFLEEIDSEAISMYSGAIMIRPYRALVYYKEQIRQRFEAIHAISEVQDDEDDHGSNHESEGEAGLDDEARSKVGPSEHTSATTLPKDKERERTIVQEDDLGRRDEDKCTPSTTAYHHLKALMDFMDNEIQKKMDYISGEDCQKVSFADIWYLFKPGDEVIGQNRRQAYRIIKITSAGHKVIPPAWLKYRISQPDLETPVVLHCVYVDFDGKRLGPVTREVKIQRFDGEKAVTSLEVFPIRYAEPKHNEREDAKQSFRERLIDRGKKFLDVTTFKHMHYSGLTLDTRDEVDAHVVVDFQEAFSANVEARWMPELETLIGQSEEETTDEECVFDCCRQETIFKDKFAERKRNEEYIAGLMPDSEDRIREPSLAIYPRALDEIKRSENELDPRDLVIMSYRVFGFVLRSRKWAELDLTYLGPPMGSRKKESSGVHFANKLDQDDNRPSNRSVTGESVAGKVAIAESDIAKDHRGNTGTQEKRQTAFDQLVLPPGHQTMILSLIAQHFRDKDASRKDDAGENEQVDIVRGKGKGLIILLHGAPGVGKTSTAEGVAEKFEKPLFQITCGDLGTTARDVDEALGTHFNLANKWGCVLLLDEADVFLAARSKEDFIRNGLVSVFLRVLEYYAGILFLTTNRVGDFDEAFTSRIHISLHYPQLQLESTREIFKLNLRLIKERFEKKNRRLVIEEDGIISFAEKYWNEHNKERWNGRQIRNACQTALALAEFAAQGSNHEQVVDAHAEVELKVRHLETVSNAYLGFMDYFNRVRDKDTERWAKALRIRAREEIVGDGTEKTTEVAKDEVVGREQPERTKQPHPDSTLHVQPAAQPTNNDSMIRSTAATPQPPANLEAQHAPAGLPPGYPAPPYYSYPPPGFQAPGYPGMHNGQHAPTQGWWGPPQPHPTGSNANHGAPGG